MKGISVLGRTRLAATGRRGGVCLLLFSMAAVPLAAGMRRTEEDRGGPFEPVLTQEENRVLQAVLETATTNAPAAIGLLKQQDLPQASPALDFALGNLFFKEGDWDRAETAYGHAIQKLPRFRGALANLGRIYLLQERTQEAIELYRRIVADGQADADLFLLLGHALFMENGFVSAETAYRQSLLLRPRHAETMTGLANTLLRQERHAEALAMVREILQADPSNGELWSLRTNIHLATGQYDEAIRAIQQARRLKCADSDLLATLGDLLLDRSQPAEALLAYKEAFDAEPPSVPRLLRTIEGFLLTGDVVEAERMMEQAEARQEKEPGLFDPASRNALLRYRAEWARQTGRPEKSLAWSEEALRADPLDGQALLLYADLLQDAGRLEEAVMACERAARIQGFEAEALVRQAGIEVERARYARAIELLETAQTFRYQPHVARYLEQIKRTRVRP